MDHRDVEGIDAPTAHNLQRLDYLARQAYALSPELLDDLLVAVIQTHRLLPPALQRHVHSSHCFTHGAHVTADQARRNAMWSAVRADLEVGLKRIIADPALKRVYAVGRDRPSTPGGAYP